MRDNGLLLNSGHNYPLLPVYPPPPKQCCILDPQVFLLLQATLIRGWGDLRQLDTMK